MQASEFEKKKLYSEASGSMSVVDSNIQMIMNEFGLYEERIIDSSKEITEIAEFVSPNLNNSVNESDIAKELYSNKENILFDERLGYYQSLYVGNVSEGDYRENGSSGGMGTWIFKELFEKNLIDYVIHVKKNNDLNSKKMFKYDISSSLEDIKAGSKTKYYPVEISEVISIVRNKPGRYAIIGIPSFIYSIRLLSKVDENINNSIKFTVGLVCGHQKSTKFAELMAWQAGIKPGNLIDIDFRHKLLDRPASSYAVKMTGIIDEKIQTIIKPTSELFGQNWGWGFFKPIASDYTDDVFNETADIVLGDAWLPEYSSDSNGNNIVIVRNSLIDKLIKDAVNEKRINMDVVESDTVFDSQASHYRHTHDELAYRLSVKKHGNEWYPDKRVEAKSEISKLRKKIQILREIISSQSHLQYQEAVKRNDLNYFIKQMTSFTSEYTKLYKKKYRKELMKKILTMSPKEFMRKVFNKLKT